MEALAAHKCTAKCVVTAFFLEVRIFLWFIWDAVLCRVEVRGDAPAASDLPRTFFGHSAVRQATHETLQSRAMKKTHYSHRIFLRLFHFGCSPTSRPASADAVPLKGMHNYTYAQTAASCARLRLLTTSRQTGERAFFSPLIVLAMLRAQTRHY